MLTDNFRFFLTLPDPLQGLQGFFIIVPFPEHAEHVRSRVKKPCCVLTFPDPPQLPQVTLSDPLAAPLPLQLSHAILEFIFKSLLVPK